MGAAALRNNRITLQSSAISRSAANDEIETWSDIATVWAERRDVRGQEYFAAQTLVDSADVIFKILYLDGVTEANRVIDVLTGEVFDVQRVVRVGAKSRELEIYARSGVRDAR